MELHVETRGDVLVVRPEDERLDAVAAIPFKEQMRGLTAGHRGPVVLDLSRVVFLDSSGLGAIVAVMKSLGVPRRLELAELQPNVDKVMRLTRMDTVFRISSSLADRLSGGWRDAG